MYLILGLILVLVWFCLEQDDKAKHAAASKELKERGCFDRQPSKHLHDALGRFWQNNYTKISGLCPRKMLDVYGGGSVPGDRYFYRDCWVDEQEWKMGYRPYREPSDYDKRSYDPYHKFRNKNDDFLFQLGVLDAVGHNDWPGCPPLPKLVYVEKTRKIYLENDKELQELIKQGEKVEYGNYNH